MLQRARSFSELAVCASGGAELDAHCAIHSLDGGRVVRRHDVEATQIHLLARRLLIPLLQQSRAAQGSDDYDESDNNEEDHGSDDNESDDYDEEDHGGYDDVYMIDGSDDYDDYDASDDNDKDEEDSVPARVIEALPRRTFMRVTRQAAPCAICLDEPTTDLTLVRLPCRHEFCEPCIIGWLKRKNACPQCRAPIQWWVQE